MRCEAEKCLFVVLFLFCVLFLKETKTCEEEIMEQRDMQTFLKRRIEEISDFEFSDAAKKLLKSEEESEAAHDANVAKLKAERESRMALVRELDRLLEQKKKLEGDLRNLKTFDAKIPKKIQELFERSVRLQGE